MFIVINFIVYCTKKKYVTHFRPINFFILFTSFCRLPTSSAMLFYYKMSH